MPQGTKTSYTFVLTYLAFLSSRSCPLSPCFPYQSSSMYSSSSCSLKAHGYSSQKKRRENKKKITFPNHGYAHNHGNNLFLQRVKSIEEVTVDRCHHANNISGSRVLSRPSIKASVVVEDLDCTH